MTVRSQCQPVHGTSGRWTLFASQNTSSAKGGGVIEGKEASRDTSPSRRDDFVHHAHTLASPKMASIASPSPFLPSPKIWTLLDTVGFVPLIIGELQKMNSCTEISRKERRENGVIFI